MQQPHIANPPTLFLSLLALLQRFSAQQQTSSGTGSGGGSGSSASAESVYAFVESVYPKLSRHVAWYFKTQTSWYASFAREARIKYNATYDSPGRQAVDLIDLPIRFLFESTAVDNAERVLSADSERRAIPSAFRWGGRTVAHNLASGLDDYPRAPFLPADPPRKSKSKSKSVTDAEPESSPTEGHADLHSWMIVLCKTMSALTDHMIAATHHKLDRSKSVNDRASFESRISELKTERDRYDALVIHLTHQMWNLHFDPDALREKNEPKWRGHSLFQDFIVPPRNDTTTTTTTSKGRNTKSKSKSKSEEAESLTSITSPKPAFIRHLGYVSLFPLMLQLLPLHSSWLTGMLRALRSDEGGVWSPYGIRSLSKHDALYGRGEDYWRGAIWINCNYLIVSALHYYGYRAPQPDQIRYDDPTAMEAAHNAQLARELYTELRGNLIRNMVKEYRRTGYLWEQYSPTDGAGRRSHPFTGWSALIVLIMGEQYT